MKAEMRAYLMTVSEVARIQIDMTSRYLQRRKCRLFQKHAMPPCRNVTLIRTSRSRAPRVGQGSMSHLLSGTAHTARRPAPPSPTGRGRTIASEIMGTLFHWGWRAGYHQHYRTYRSPSDLQLHRYPNMDWDAIAYTYAMRCTEEANMSHFIELTFGNACKRKAPFYARFLIITIFAEPPLFFGIRKC